MTTLGGQALRTGQRRVEPPTYLGGHTGHTRKPFSKDGSGIPNRMAGGGGGNRQLQPQDLGQGLPSHPEGCQAGRGSSELSRRKELLTEGSAQRRGRPEGSRRPVLTAVKHRGAGPAQCGCPGGPSRGPYGISICWGVWQAWGWQGGWATCVAASERQQGCRGAPGGRQGIQSREVQNAGGNSEKARGGEGGSWEEVRGQAGGHRGQGALSGQPLPHYFPF